MISRTGRHALGALVELARLPAGRLLGAAALARRIGAPANYLGKLLQTLAQVGLLESRKGPGGGFRLARAPGDVALIDVLRPFENLERWDRCALGLAECSDENACALHFAWKRQTEELAGLLSRTTLADLACASPGPGHPRGLT